MQRFAIRCKTTTTLVMYYYNFKPSVLNSRGWNIED